VAFEEDASGQVVKAIFHQPQGVFEATRNP